MFFHSTDWGFDFDYQKKKENSREVLSQLDLSILNSFSYTYFELLDNLSLIDSNEVYLVTVDSTIASIPRHGYFDVSSIPNLLETIVADFGSDNTVLKTCRCYFIEQLFACKGCFTGALISDSKGNLICEVIDGIIDNRELTSGSSKSLYRKLIVYVDGKLSSCDDYLLWSKLLPQLEICIKYKGYFEFTFGRVRNKLDVYFSYFSSDKTYLNIFNNDVRIFSDMITCRCIERCYLQYIGKIQ